METVNIVGAGLAGLSAALTLAKQHQPCRLISVQASERAQSVLAEGGINGALNNMGEGDSILLHEEDTCLAGCQIADEEAVRGLTGHAPAIIQMLADLGVPFNRQDGKILQRSFGGQRKKRTAFAKSSTGKMIMHALIDEVRKYEVLGLIRRYPHHLFVDLVIREVIPEQAQSRNPEHVQQVQSRNSEHVQQVQSRISEHLEQARRGELKERVCCGLLIRDVYTGEETRFTGPVLMACGGMNGLFPSRTTGTLINSGNAAAKLFAKGVRFSNLEMIQYHPTTIAIAGKRLLISEAARGEGGRLFVRRAGEPWYFMEEKYPEFGNLMPRDVVSREMYFVTHESDCEPQVYLDMRGISKEIFQKRLSDLRAELLHYGKPDPEKEPIPVEQGIHYFMGGIDVDVFHQTNLRFLYAAGECCSQYHGANRLGGNSMLGALYGGQVAAKTILKEGESSSPYAPEAVAFLHAHEESASRPTEYAAKDDTSSTDPEGSRYEEETPQITAKMASLLYESLGIIREEKSMRRALEGLSLLLQEEGLTETDRNRIMLGEAILRSALFRKESRGAHFRSDFPERDESFCGLVTAIKKDGKIEIDIKKKREDLKGRTKETKRNET
ncbi:MAG: FAD-binding protein [Lachnospiraceae bacterium]|nr:FAD-binding protein [Lachnospiraceae bacterium]MBF1012693.1 FAD-binding protein [Lachnospiraceae bacterium]